MTHEQFLEKYIPEPMTGCWLWIGALRGNNYGGFSNVYAHRWAYELYREEIPIGLTIDHLCGVKLCVNPWHLEVVSLRENILRSNGITAQYAKRTHCKSGHLLIPENLRKPSPGTAERRCKLCERRKDAKRYALNPEKFQARARAYRKQHLP